MSHRLPGEELGGDGRRAARRVLHPSLAGLLAAVSLYLAVPSLSWAQTADSLPRRLPIEDLPYRTGQVLTGQSVLRFIVDGSGRIDRCSIAIVEETTPAWTDAVVRELRSAHYQPARRQGQPVRVGLPAVHLSQRRAPAALEVTKGMHRGAVRRYRSVTQAYMLKAIRGRSPPMAVTTLSSAS